MTQPALQNQVRPQLDLHPNWIVVYDPAGRFTEGSLVDLNKRRALQVRGAVLLPVIPDLFKKSGVGGYMRRGWGAGFPLDGIVPKMACPMVTFGSPELKTVHWRARLVADAPLLVKAHAGGKFQGSFRLSVDTAQVNPLNAGMLQNSRPVEGQELGAPDERGGWTVGGAAGCNFPTTGHYGFGLYGTMPGIRVAWAALSLTTPLIG